MRFPTPKTTLPLAFHLSVLCITVSFCCSPPPLDRRIETGTQKAGEYLSRSLSGVRWKYFKPAVCPTAPEQEFHRQGARGNLVYPAIYLRALESLPDENAERRELVGEIRNWLEKNRSKGLWGFGNGFLPTATDTAFLAEALFLGQASGRDPKREKSVLRTMKSLAWFQGPGGVVPQLCGKPDPQNPRGEFTMPREATTELWCRPDTHTTAHVNYLYLKTNPNRYQKEIQQNARFIAARQEKNGAWLSYWKPNAFYGTWLALRGLPSTGKGYQNNRKSALTFLKKTQQPDGSWGWPQGERSFSTALALLALNHLRSGKNARQLEGATPPYPQIDLMMARGLDWLLNSQREDGSFTSGTLTSFSRVVGESLDYTLCRDREGLATTAFAILALRAASGANKPEWKDFHLEKKVTKTNKSKEANPVWGPSGILQRVSYAKQAEVIRQSTVNFKKKYDVIIVGGGLSGLAAAAALKNKTVLLLEKEVFAGGRARTVKFFGRAFDLGASFAYAYPEPPLNKLNALLRPVQGKVGFYFKEELWRVDRSLPQTLKKAGISGKTIQNLAKLSRGRLPLAKLTTGERDLANSLFQTIYPGNIADYSPRLAGPLLEVLNNKVYRGGNTRLVNALVHQINTNPGKSVVRGALVTGVWPVAGGGRVTGKFSGQDFKVHGSRVILATDGKTAHRLWKPTANGKSETESVADLAGKTEYGSYTTVAMVFPGRPPKKKFSYIISPELPFNITLVRDDPGTRKNGFYGLIAYYTTDMSNKARKLNGPEIFNLTLEHWHKMGLARSEPLFHARQHWSRAGTLIENGSREKLPEKGFLKEKSVYFAGDYLIRDLPYGVRAALASGRAVAREINHPTVYGE